MMFIHAMLAAQLAASTIVQLPESTSGSVRVLHVDSKPVARSYDGLDWERTQGGATLDIDCSGGACQADISTDSVYNITSHPGPDYTSLQKASRFLVQGTFGPTRATLDSVDATTGAGFTKWIEDQMALPPTLHREYYRRRANPRLFTARNAGGVRAPCEAGSRWHLFSFNRADEGKKLRVNNAVFHIEGEHVRTENAGDDLALDNMTICVVEERVGGAIHLLPNLEDCTNNRKLDKEAKILINPQVTFSLAAGHAANRTLNASEGVLIQLPGVRNASILQNDLKCNNDLKWCNDLECKHDLFLFDGSTYWRHDARLKLLTNTIEELYDDSVSTGAVPFVAKTFLNEHTCVAKPNANLSQATQWPADTNPVRTRVYEVCGSPGEVANAPSEANRYNIILTDKSAAPGDSYPMDIPTVVADETDDSNDLHSFNRDRTGGGAGSSQGSAQGTGDLAAGKNVVWSTVVLRAEDQLRQRVAWALSQIFVVSDTAGKVPFSEPWHTYYDIFVRHAFGNYRDVMREVSYSPMMGDYLSFSGNKAKSFDGSYPDENFAREIMQLFSIGLYKLNSDGALPRAVHTAPSIYGTYTVQRTHCTCTRPAHTACACAGTPFRNKAGEAVSTYTNDDVQTFARAWTGHQKQACKLLA